MNKSAVPPELLELLKPASNPKLKLVQPADTSGIFKLVPKDKRFESFLFAVEKKHSTQTSGRPIQYVCKINPANRNGDLQANIALNNSEISKRLSEWLSIIEQYHQSDTVFDDPILARYQADFESKFKMMENDADIAPFDLEKQIYVVNYLDWVITEVEKYSNDETKNEIEIIKQESELLKSEITKETKNGTIRRLSKIWARAQRIGVDLIKEIFIKVSAEIIVRLIGSGNDHTYT